MTDENNLEKVAMALYVYAAQLVKEGKSREQIIKILTDRGLSQEAAETIMTRLDTSRDNVTRRSGFLFLVFGAILIMISLFPLFNVIVPDTGTLGTVIAILVMAIGVVVMLRGVLKVVATLQSRS